MLNTAPTETNNFYRKGTEIINSGTLGGKVRSSLSTQVFEMHSSFLLTII